MTSTSSRRGSQAQARDSPSTSTCGRGDSGALKDLSERDVSGPVGAFTHVADVSHITSEHGFRGRGGAGLSLEPGTQRACPETWTCALGLVVRNTFIDIDESDASG